MTAPERLPLAACLALYARYRPGLQSSTMYQMRLAVRLLNRWAGHAVSTEELDDELLVNYLYDYSHVVAPATVNCKRRQLLALWRFAYERKLTARPPGKIPRMPERLPLPEAWTLAEVARILAEAGVESGTIAGVSARHWWQSLLLAIYDTGGRIGELRKVTPADISLEGRYLVLRTADCKGGKPRYCPLSDQTVGACALIYRPDRELMWPWPFTREWLGKAFKRILKRAGVRYGQGRGGLFHKLRRTSGTLVEMAGGDGSRQLGNSRAVFERHYLDPRILGRGQVGLLPRPQPDCADGSVRPTQRAG